MSDLKMPASGSSVVLGFDIRIGLTAGADAFWDDRRRSEFLIRPDVKMPISVDRAVWPALVDAPGAAPLGLWNSADTALLDLAAATPAHKHAVLVEIAVIASTESLDYWQNLSRGWLEEISDLSPHSFDTLGFDIADQYLLSGLSNCMLRPEELLEIRRHWVASMNDFGLLNTLSEANGLIDVLNPLVPEHAPFHAFRVRALRRTPM